MSLAVHCMQTLLVKSAPQLVPACGLHRSSNGRSTALAVYIQLTFALAERKLQRRHRFEGYLHNVWACLYCVNVVACGVSRCVCEAESQISKSTGFSAHTASLSPRIATRRKEISSAMAY